MAFNPFLALSEQWDDSKSYLRRPIAWTREVAHIYPHKVQRKILNSVRDNRYTAVPASHGVGKSLIAADAISWWIDAHPPGEAFVVSTAPSSAQVSSILWREIARIHGKQDLPGRINRAGYPKWYIGDELVGYGRKPADYQESAFQGIHARYVLVVIDEAGGVQKHLFDAVDALATNKNARVLAIGNPDDAGSHFASICKPSSGWNVIQIDGLRSPNITRERVVGDDGSKPNFPLLAALIEAEGISYNEEKIPEELREMLIDETWIEERISRWAGVPKNASDIYNADELKEIIVKRCAASSLFQAKVRGIFPDSSSEGVIPLGWVTQAVARWHDWNDNAPTDGFGFKAVANPTATVVGIDVAYSEKEGDETAFAIRNGNVVKEIIRLRSADTVEIADAACNYLRETKSFAVVDVIGYGAGVHDTLRRYRRDNLILATSIPFNAGAKSPRTDMLGEFRFRNDRAAMWWKMRELLDPSRGSNICLPDDERLIEELVAPKYKVNVGGIIQVEEKAEIRKRIGRSTDAADAVLQSFWIEGLANNEVMRGYAYNNGSGSGGVIPYDGYSTFREDSFNDSIGSEGNAFASIGAGIYDDWDV